MSLRRWVGLATMCVGLLGCGSAAKPALPSSISTLSISYMPKILMTNSMARFVCRMPESIKAGQYIFGVTGLFESQGPIDQIEFTREVQVGCESIHLYCGFQEMKDTGWQKPQVITLDVEPVGDCGSEHESNYSR